MCRDAVCYLTEYTIKNRATIIECLTVFIVLLFRCSSLYEQDEANVFAEPSVMSAHVLPYLLRMVEKSSESSALAQTLSAWAEQSAVQVLQGIAVCKEIFPGITLASQYDHKCVFEW